MKYFITFVMSLLLLCGVSFSQNLGFHGVAAQAGLVVPSETGYTAGFALGAKVNMGEIADKLTLMPLVQYHKPGFDVPAGAGDATISIFVIGADVHYAINEQFYAGGGLNYNSITLEYKVTIPFFGTTTIDGSDSNIGFSALGGYNFDLGGLPSAIEARYNIVSNYNSLVIMLNVFFGTK